MVVPKWLKQPQSSPQSSGGQISSATAASQQQVSEPNKDEPSETPTNKDSPGPPAEQPSELKSTCSLPVGEVRPQSASNYNQHEKQHFAGWRPKENP